MKIQVVVLSTILGVASLDAMAAVSTRRQATIVGISQTVTGPAGGVKSKIDVNVGASTQTRGAMAMAPGSVRVSDQGTASFMGLPVQDFSTLTKTVCSPVYYRLREADLDSDGTGSGGCQTVGYGEAEISTAFDQSIDSRAPQLISDLAALVKAHGASAGIFTYEQELTATALGGRRRLVWSALMDPSGKVLYGKSKVIASTQYYVYMTYTPLAVSPKLPQSWQYQNAGTLGWALVNEKMQALEPGSLIDTAGFFDEPPEQTGADAIVKCLVDHSQAGCSTQFPDAATLIAQSGAAGAFIDYLHAVEPRYINVESPAGSGDYTAVAELTLQVPSRTVATAFDPTCLVKSYTYSNSGTYQFNLNHSMTRYFAEKSQYQFKSVAEASSKVTSPAQSYSASMGVSDASLGALPGLYIDPFGEEGPLVDLGLVPAGSSFAPVDYLPPPACTPVVSPTPPVGP